MSKVIKSNKIISYSGLLLCTVATGGIFYFLSNPFLQRPYQKCSFVDCFGIAVLVCAPSCIIYLIINNSILKKNSFWIRVVISILSFAAVLFGLSALAPYGTDYSTPQAKRSMLIFLLTSLCLPFFEKMIFGRKVKIKAD
jgi:hypothetical protein